MQKNQEMQENKQMQQKKEIFTRYDMYAMLLTNYNYTGKKDWDSIEKFLAKQYNCDCTDCGGHDTDRPCNVETQFSKKFRSIRKFNMV